MTTITNSFKNLGIALAMLALVFGAATTALAAEYDGGEWYGGDYDSGEWYGGDYDSGEWYGGDYDYDYDYGYDDYDYGYDSECYSCGGSSGGGSIGGGFIGQPSNTNVNNNQNQNQNQSQNINTNNVSVNVEYPKEEKKHRDYDRDRDHVVYQQPPVYYPPYNPTPYVTLSQTPYTGLELTPMQMVFYWGFLVLWCLLAAYLIVVKKVHVGLANRIKVALFGDDSEVSHPVYATAGAQAPQSEVAKLAEAFLEALEGKTTPSYEAKKEVVQTDSTDPFILSQIHRSK
jgi:hypothetical protein